MRILLLLVLVLSMNLTRSVFCETPAVKRLRAAAVLGLTGQAAYHSQGIRYGVELAKEELEKRRWSIEIQYEDDHTEPAKTVSAFQSLLARDYRFFLGPTWSFQASAVRPILQRNMAIAFVPAGSSEINGGAAEGMFNLCPSREQQMPQISSWLKEKGYKRAFLLTANGDWGEVHAKVFREAVQSSGGTVIGQEQFEYGIDVGTLSTLLLKAERMGVDLIMTTGGGGDVANIVRARNIRKQKVVVLSTDDIRDALLQGLVAKSDLTDVYALGLTVSPEFEDRYRARFGEAPSLYADRGYDALMVLAYATERTDGTASAVRAYLKSQHEYQGVIGPIAFDERGDVKTGHYQIVDAAK